MKVIEFSRKHAQPIELFNSVAASSSKIGDGIGEAHIYCIYFDSGSKIGEHYAGYGQLFLVVDGEGWVVGGDGNRVKLSSGQGAYFEKGELHSKGSDSGMTVIMVQVSSLEPKAIQESET